MSRGARLGRALAALAFAAVARAATAAEPAAPFPSYDAFLAELERAASVPEAARRAAAIDALWERLRAADQIPYRDGDRVAFLYRDRGGEAVEVALRGDLTGWRIVGSHRARRVGLSDVWILEDRLPAEARVDYKWFVDGRFWTLDLDNPRQQLGGFGPNSELRMPSYRPPPEVEERPGVPSGQLGERRLLASSVLGYEVAYRVYLPHGYGGGGEPLPAVYLSDGQDYAHPRMGSVPRILDNRIADGGLPPLVAVFVDPRHPRSGDNRREREYGDEPERFARFLADELVPAVDGSFRTAADPRHRVVVGTSLGGLLAAWAVLHHSEVFGGALVQSPAFEFDRHRGDRLRNAYATAKPPPVRLFLGSGTLFDGLDDTRAFRNLLVEKGYELEYVEVDEGHSWGQWRAWVDDGLAFLLRRRRAGRSPAGRE